MKIKIKYIIQDTSIDIYESGLSEYELTIKIYEFISGKLTEKDMLYIYAMSNKINCNENNFKQCDEFRIVGNIDLIKQEYDVIIEDLIGYTEEYHFIYVKDIVKHEIKKILKELGINIFKYKINTVK